MPITTYEEAMLPVLCLLAKSASLSRRELAGSIANHFGLTESERGQLLPSGKAPVILSRVGWALTYLKQAGLVDSVKRGVYCISARGRQVLAGNPQRIDSDTLDQFPEFREFKVRSKTGKLQEISDVPDVQVASKRSDHENLPPEETFEDAYANLRRAVESELLDQVKAASPEFFERLVVDLVVRMGYGGNRQEAARAVGKSGDEGIDGVIDEDRLGLDTIYLQAKRWENPVSRPEIQKFAGALQGQRARKGIFITTSSFTKEAREFVQKIDSRIVLLDGQRLAELMFEFDVGVAPRSTFIVKAVDGDYFDEI